MPNYPRPTQQDLARADQIRSTAAASIARAESNKALSAGAVEATVAKITLAANAELAALSERSKANTEATRKSRLRSAFGLEDVTNGVSMSRLTAAADARAANAHVAKIENADEAMGQFRLAEVNGDEVLAKALAMRAYDQRAADTTWEEVISGYAASRPKAESAIRDLLSEDVRPTAVDLFAFVPVATPRSLAGVPQSQWSAIATSTEYDASPAPTTLYEDLRKSQGY